MIGKQLTYLGIYLMIICLIKNYIALIKYDLYDKKDIRNRGQITIELLLKTMDMYVIGLDSQYCDPSTSYLEDKFCDIVMRWKFCYDETLPYGQNLSTDMGSKCGKSEKKILAENTRFFYYVIDNGLHLDQYNVLYPYVGYIYSDIVDGSLDWVKNYYETDMVKMYTFFEPRVNEFIVSRWKGITIGWKSIAMIEYAILTNCQNNNDYGSTCWLTCVEDSRKTCNCNANKRGSDYACTIQCKPGWVNLIVKILVKNNYVSVRICFIKDHCQKIKVCKQENATCLPYDNYTALCEIFEIVVYSQIQMPVIDSQVLYYGEKLVVNIKEDLIYSKEILPTISVNPDMHEEAFWLGIFGNLKVTHHTQMEVVSKKYLDINYALTFYVNLDAWDKVLIRNKTFRINVIPGILQILHLDGLQTVNDVVYIGEQLFCNNSAQPEYRSIILWKADIINITAPMMAHQTIEENNPLFKGFISCKVFMVNKGRELITNSINLTVRVLPFVIFDWSNPNDLIYKFGKLSCIVKTYVNYNVKIIQIEGYTHYYTPNSEINLEDLRGDEYAFTCMYNTSLGFFSTRYKKFSLITHPSTICVFLHPSTLGAIVQCGHDGYIKESYSMSIMVTTIDYSSIPFNEGINYLRIPYDLPTKHVIISCVLRDKYTTQIMLNHTFAETISEEPEGIYEFGLSQERCTSFTRYVERPDIVKFLSKKEVKLAHIIYFLEFETIKGDIHETLLIYIFLSIFVIISILPSIFEKCSTHGLSGAVAYCSRTNKWRVRRMINEELNRMAVDMIKYKNVNEENTADGDAKYYTPEKKSADASEFESVIANLTQQHQDQFQEQEYQHQNFKDKELEFADY